MGLGATTKRVKVAKNSQQSELDNFAEIVYTVLDEVDLRKNPRKKNEETLEEPANLKMRFTSKTARKGYGRETKAG